MSEWKILRIRDCISRIEIAAHQITLLTDSAILRVHEGGPCPPWIEADIRKIADNLRSLTGSLKDETG